MTMIMTWHLYSALISITGGPGGSKFAFYKRMYGIHKTRPKILPFVKIRNENELPCACLEGRGTVYGGGRNGQKR